MVNDKQVSKAWDKMNAARAAEVKKIEAKTFNIFLKALGKTEDDFDETSLKIIRSVVLNNDPRYDVVLHMVD